MMNYLDKINIHQPIKDRFIKSIKNNRLAHSYIFYGPEGMGKEAIAIELSKALNCLHPHDRPCHKCASCIKIGNLNHPDVHFIFPTNINWSNEEIAERLKKKAKNPFSRIDLSGNTTIQIDRIRELKNQAKYSPYEAQKKVFIVSSAEQMSREGANAFLKLLEEPPESLIIILITTDVNSLLDTIRSRCQRIYFPYLKISDTIEIVKHYREVDSALEQLIRISNCNLKEIFDNLDREVDEKRSQVYEYLRAIASGNPYLLMETVDNITRVRDKNYLMEVVNLITLWFRDALHFTHLGEHTEMINIDFNNEMKNFVKAYHDSNFSQIFKEIEEVLANINQNIYSPLLMTVLGIRIKKNLVRKFESK